MTAGQRVTLDFARVVAGVLLKNLMPHTERMEIAGSIRREKPDIGDVELLYIPRVTMAGQASFLGDSRGVVDLLDVELQKLLRVGAFAKRLNERGYPIGYGPQNKMLTHAASGLGVDIFRATPANWGMALVVRTGPAEWNVEMMSAFRRLGMEGHAYGGMTVNGQEMECPTEASVFALLGLAYVPPSQRANELARLRAIGKGLQK